MTIPSLQSPLLAAVDVCVHGFFGREGGVSQGNLASLNITLRQACRPQEVHENRKRVMRAVMQDGKAYENCYVKQQHTNAVVFVDETFASDEIIADAMVTNIPGYLLCIQTADCVPVLFVDPMNKIIGAAHAGWRGLSRGVLQATLTEMVARGCDLSTIHAAIGPCAWAEDYEVKDDVRLAFDASYHGYFAPCSGEGDALVSYAFDLPGLAMKILKDVGVQYISASQANTYANRESYFSYRRTTHDGDSYCGGQASVIGLVTV